MVVYSISLIVYTVGLALKITSLDVQSYVWMLNCLFGCPVRQVWGGGWGGDSKVIDFANGEILDSWILVFKIFRNSIQQLQEDYRNISKSIKDF